MPWWGPGVAALASSLNILWDDRRPALHSPGIPAPSVPSCDPAPDAAAAFQRWGMRVAPLTGGALAEATPDLPRIAPDSPAVPRASVRVS